MGLIDGIRRFAGISLAVTAALFCLAACSPAASDSSGDGASSAQEKAGSSPFVHTSAEIEAMLAELESGQEPEQKPALTERPDGKAIAEGLPFKEPGLAYMTKRGKSSAAAACSLVELRIIGVLRMERMMWCLGPLSAMAES